MASRRTENKVYAIIPRWISFLLLIFGIIFFGQFIWTSINNQFMFALGIISAIMWLAIIIYQLVKGQSPSYYKISK